MPSLDRTLLRAWRGLAFLGYHSGLDSLVDTGANKVLRYHSIGGGFYDDIGVDAFRRQVEFLTSEYEVVDLPAVLEPGDTDAERVALTFDDGYRDFREYVVPTLREYDVPATVFVIVNALEDPEFNHNDRAEYEYMDRDEVLDLVDEELVTVGNHTLSHPRLDRLPRERLETEIVEAKHRLEEMLGTDVSRFCYPYNDWDERAAEVVRETHDIGVLSRGRFEQISPETDPATVPRINGASPFYELCWDLSDTSTYVGRAGSYLLGLR